MHEFNLADQSFLVKLKEIVLSNIEKENFGVKELAQAAGMNYFHLNRRLHSILNKNTTQFIREIRLETAREMLEKGEITASEVAYKAGFGSPAYFNRCFHEYFGYAPGEIKKRTLGKNKENNDESFPADKEEEANLQEKQPPVKKRKRKLIILATIGVLISGCLSLLYFYPSFKNSILKLNPEEKSIAVLPFKNLSKEYDYLYFAEGVTGSILNNLMFVEKLKVISLISAEIDKPGNQSATDIVKKTGVNYILSGSVQYDKGRFLILVQLTDAKTNLQIWSDQMDGEMSDIFKIQSEIAQKIANKLHAVLSQKEIRQINKIPTRITVAYSHYLKGQYFLKRRETDQSIDCFKKAIAADSTYADAYAGLGDAFFIGTKAKFYQRPAGYEKAKENTLRALRLDNNLAEAHATLGALLCLGEWKWEEGRKELLEAIRLNPSCVTAHQYYGEMLLILREFSDARAHLTLACELDPISSMILILSARYYESQGKFPQALEECRKIIELTPRFWGAYFYSFYIYRRTGEELKAVDAIEQALSISEQDKKYAVRVKEVYHLSGMTGLYNLLIEYESEDLVSGILGLSRLYCWLGKKDKALDCLEKAMMMEKRYPDLPRINYEFDFQELRNEPRFQALLDSMGLTPYQ